MNIIRIFINALRWFTGNKCHDTTSMGISHHLHNINYVLSVISDAVSDVKKENISNIVIIVTSFNLGYCLLARRFGISEAKDIVRRMEQILADESRIPISSIIGLTLPEHPAQHYDIVNGVFCRTIGRLEERNFEIGLIAQAFLNYATILSVHSVDEVFARAMLKKYLGDME